MGDYSYGRVIPSNSDRVRERNLIEAAKAGAFAQTAPSEGPTVNVYKNKATVPKTVPLAPGARIKVWWPLDRAWYV